MSTIHPSPSPAFTTPKTSESHKEHDLESEALMTHLTGDGMESAAHRLESISHDISNALKLGDPKVLKTPIVINGEVCTHHIGPIYGNKNAVIKLAKSMEEIHGHSPKLYQFINTNLVEGRVAIVAIEEPGKMNFPGQIGFWNRVTEEGLSSQFKTKILINLKDIEKNTNRTIVGTSAHEWTHELVDFNSSIRNNVPFMSMPSVNSKLANELVETWVKTFENYKSSLPSPGVPTPNSAGGFFFKQTSFYYQKWQNLKSEADNLIKELGKTVERPARQIVEYELCLVTGKAAEAKAVFLAEIPSHFIETKINYGQKTISHLTGNLGHKLDELFGERFFLEPNWKIAAARYTRTALTQTSRILHKTGRALGHAALALDLFEGIMLSPRREGSYAEHLAQGVLIGCTKFSLHCTLAPLYIGAFLESLQPPVTSPEKQQQKAYELRQIAFTMSSGRAYCNKNQDASFVNERPILSEVLKSIEGFTMQVVKKLFKNSPVGFFTQLLDKHVINPRVSSDPDVFVAVAEDMISQLTTTIKFPEGFFTWSPEKQASWSKELSKQSAQIMGESIIKHESEKTQREKWGDYLGAATYWGETAVHSRSLAAKAFAEMAKEMDFLSNANRERLMGAFASAQPTTPSAEEPGQTLPSVFSDEYQLHALDQAMNKAAELPPTQGKSPFPKVRQMPKEKPDINPDLFKPKPALVVKPSPLFEGGIRITPPSGGVGVDVIASTSGGIAIAGSVNLLNIGEASAALSSMAELAAAAAPIALPLAFAAFVALRLKCDLDERSATKKAREVGDDRNADFLDVYNHFTKEWTPIIEKAPGDLNGNDAQMLAGAVDHIGEKIKKIENSITEIDNNKDLGWEEKIWEINRLATGHENLFIKRQIIQNRLELENYHTKHITDTPEQLLIILQDSTFTDPIKRSILLHLLLPQIAKSDDGLSQIKKLQSLFPENSLLNQVRHNIDWEKGIAKALEGLTSNLSNLKLGDLLKTLRAYFEELYPKTTSFSPTAPPSPKNVSLMNVVGLKEENRNLEKDLSCQKPNDPGFNRQFSHLNSLSFSEMNIDFIDGLLAKLNKKKKGWWKIHEDGDLTYNAWNLLVTKANTARRNLNQIRADKVFYDELQGKEFEALLPFVQKADGEIQEQLIQSALEMSLEHEMNIRSENLPDHLTDFLKHYSDQNLQTLANSLERREWCLSILDKSGEIHTLDDVKALIAKLQQNSPDQTIEEISKDVLNYLEETLKNEYTLVHNGLLAVSKEEEGADLEIIQTKLAQLFEIDSKRFKELYQSWIENFLVNGKREIAIPLMNDWQKGSAGNPQLESEYESFKKSVQPFIDYHEKGNVSLRALTNHYKIEYEKAEEKDKELIKSLYWNTFAPFVQKRLKNSSELLGLLFKTLGTDFINNPTLIPFLRQYRQEDFEKNGAYQQSKKLVGLLQAINNLDPMIIPALLLNSRFREGIHTEIFTSLVWNHKDFTPTVLKDIFINGDFDTRKSIAALIRVGDLLLYAGLGQQRDPHPYYLSNESTLNPLAQGTKTAMDLTRLFLAENRLNVFEQTLPHVFNAFENALEERTGELIDDDTYHLVKQTVAPALAAVSAFHKGGVYAAVPSAAYTAYKGASAKDYANRNKLLNLQKAITDSRLEEAAKKVEQMAETDFRADDHDTYNQLIVALHSAKAQCAASNAEKEKEYCYVISTTDHWLNTSPTEETSKEFPSNSTLMQRGMALLSVHESMDKEESTKKFETLLEHYEHRGIIPHQLLTIYNYQISPFSIASACHYQMAQNKRSELPPREQEEILQLSTLISYGMDKLGYEKIKKPEEKPIVKKARQAPQILLPPQMLSETETLEKMERIDPALYQKTMTYLQIETKPGVLKAFLNKPEYHIDISKHLKTSDTAFIYGWKTFLYEMLDAHSRTITKNTYKGLDTCIEYGFTPPSSLGILAMMSVEPQAKKRKIEEILSLFNFDSLQMHQKILIFLELSKPSYRYCVHEAYKPGICNKIRTVIGKEHDKDLLEAIKWNPNYPYVKSLLEKGASPDQVYDWKSLKNFEGYALGRQRINRRLSHVLAEYGRADLIDLFAEYGADFNLGNFYDMNALEHILAKAPLNDNSLRTRHVSKALIRGGIRPDQCSSKSTSVYNGREGGNPIGSALSYAFDTMMFKTPMWHIGWLDKTALVNLQHFCGWSADQIAEYKGITIPRHLA